MMRGRNESGVSIVEAAFVLPLLFMFVFGLVDLGMWTFNSNQATNAARDGARAGILSYQDADDRDAIVAAVQKRLPEGTVDPTDVSISCHTVDGGTVTCANAEHGDEIHVQVDWTWELVTPIAALLGIQKGDATGTASMVIVGLPVAGGATPDDEYDGDPEEPPVDVDDDTATPPVTEPPPECAILDVPIVTPSHIKSKDNQLVQDLVVTFTTDGSPACADLRVDLTGTGTDEHPPTTLSFDCACGEGPNHTWVYGGSDNIWQKHRNGEVEIVNGASLVSRSFPVS